MFAFLPSTKKIFVAVDKFSTDLYRDFFSLYKNTSIPQHIRQLQSRLTSTHFVILTNTIDIDGTFSAPPLSSLGPLRPLRPLAPPLVLLPLALATNISRKDEDVGNQMGGVVTQR